MILVLKTAHTTTKIYPRLFFKVKTMQISYSLITPKSLESIKHITHIKKKKSIDEENNYFDG